MLKVGFVKIDKEKFLFLLFLAAGIFLRFYNLNWGSPYYFHPDERNIAAAISQMRFPTRMDPHFFAYGSFPIYLIYFGGVFGNLFMKSADIWRVDFSAVIITGRLLSAALSSAPIWLVYYFVRRRHATGRALVAAFLTAIAPGLIQFAHFMTFETILTFEYFLFLIFCQDILRQKRWRDYLAAGVILGAALATKVTSLLLVPIIVVAHWWPSLHLVTDKSTEGYSGKISRFFRWLVADWEKLAAAMLVAVLMCLLFSPYAIIDFQSFRSAIKYESDVALGRLPVFYNAGFLKTIPLVYQALNVFPYLFGPVLWVGIVVGLGYIFASLIAGGGKGGRGGEGIGIGKGIGIGLLLLFVCVYLISHGFMYVKWIRYMVPVVPFLLVLFVLALAHFARRLPRLARVIAVVACVGTLISGLSFARRYFLPDTRVAAAEWAEENLPADANVLSEVYDLGILPFNDVFGVGQIKLFNFYDLDGSFGQCLPAPPTSLREVRRAGTLTLEEEGKLRELSSNLAETDYIVLPSRRIYGTRLRLPECFPNGYKFYSKLFDGDLGFNLIYGEAPNSLLLPEETYEVFDNPVVLIFEKDKALSSAEYFDMLTK